MNGNELHLKACLLKRFVSEQKKLLFLVNRTYYFEVHFFIFQNTNPEF